MFPCILLSLAIFSAPSSPQVTTSEYCAFLNAAAAIDQYNLYDEKMDDITRTGTPGFYRYDATTEDAEKPVPYLTSLAGMRYCNWLEPSASTSTCNLNSKMDLSISILAEQGVYELEEDQLLSINPEAPFFLAPGAEEMMSDFLLAGNVLEHDIIQILPQPPPKTSGTIENVSFPMYQASSITSKHPVTIMGNLIEFFCTYGGMFAGLLAGTYLAVFLCTLLALEALGPLALTLLGGTAFMGLILGLITGRALGRVIGSWIG